MSSRSNQNPAQSSTADQISSRMSIDEILAQLQKHGNKDVTSRLSVEDCGQHPVSTGGFGDLYLGKFRNGRNVALKRLRLIVGTSDDEVESRKQITRAAHEIYVWSKCKHPNVLELIGIAQYQSQIVMVSPWMPKGNLSWFLSQSRGTGVDVYNMCAQIADGVAHLHSKEIVHGDIKGVNILVSDDHVPKLADFGTSLLGSYTLQFTSSAESGRSFTVRYTPREILMEESKASIKGDIHSLGMTILEAITGSPPYDGLREDVIVSRIFKKQHPNQPQKPLSENKEHAKILWDLLTHCWTFKPEGRPDASEVAETLRGIQSTIDIKMSVCQILGCLKLHGCDDLTEMYGNVDLQPGKYSDGSTGYDIFHVGDMGFRRLAANQPTDQRRFQRDLAHEIYIWSLCRHPNILKLIGAARISGKLAMVYRWKSRGTLNSYIKRQEIDRCELCTQLASAIAYLHSKKIAHGDIKMSNILVSFNGTAQLFGFSYARMYKYDELKFLRLRAREFPLPMWVAPENKGNGPCKATYEADVYALGKTILEIILHDQPEYRKFDPSPDGPRLPRRPEQRLPVGNEHADRLWSLLRRCWSRNPGDRPNASHVRNATKDSGGSTPESEEEDTTEQEEISGGES